MVRLLGNDASNDDCPIQARIVRRLDSVLRRPVEPAPNFGSSDAHSMILSARIRIVGGTLKFEAL
ncbi:MAG TPA: hypothetical protein VK577_13675, partial [Bradyrhizobium sp.]|nr:hypothetical protein [Bradyrhizobium sp.]